jgi:hypothetical protein
MPLAMADYRGAEVSCFHGTPGSHATRKDMAQTAKNKRPSFSRAQ